MKAGHQNAQDATVKAALGSIVADEERHAELAWDILAYCLEVGSDEVRAAVEATLTTLASGGEAASQKEGLLEGLEAHGWVGAAEQDEIRRGVRAAVIGRARKLIERPAQTGGVTVAEARKQR
jgi:hypothetical protein